MEAIILGKASRKLAKKQQENKNGEQQEKISEIKNCINECKQNNKYEDGLSLVAELMDMNCQDIDVIFDAAELYFMAGDYQRSNIWIEKTLEFSPEHIGARIVLARICLLGDRIDTGLDILEVALKIGRENMTSTQDNDVREMLSYYQQVKGKAEFNNSYPYAGKFLGLLVKEESVSMSQDREQEIRYSVDNEIMAVQAKEDKNDIKTAKQKIKEKSVSLQEKISLYNSFAGAYYYDNRLDAAKEMLVEANSLDEYNEETLRNLALLSAEMHDKGVALKYASKLQYTDFSLLKLIRD